jgi:hypothetical protein
LYVTRASSGSSLLPPDTPLIRSYVGRDYISPVRDEKIATRTLASVLDEQNLPPVRMMKLDAQGAELEILQGMGTHLDSVVSVELEAGLHEIYSGQPRYCTVEGFLVDHGFELFDVRTARANRTRDGTADGYNRQIFGVHGRSPSISARVWDVDALFFRNFVEVVERGLPVVRLTVAALCTYNFFSEAYYLLEEAEGDSRWSSDVDALKRAVVAWHRKKRRRYHGASYLAGCVRAVVRRTRLDGQLRWEQYAWRRYPDA